MDGAQFVGVRERAYCSGAGHGEVEAVDEDQHDVAAQRGRLGRLARRPLRASACPRVLAVQADEPDDKERGEDETTQAPSVNFVTAKMRTTVAERDGGEAVDDEAALPVPRSSRRGGADHARGRP